MPDRPWKVAERRVAKTLGGVRNRMSGAVNQLTAGDVVHPDLYVEVKYRARFAIVTLAREVRDRARIEGKLPVLVLQQAGDDVRYYVVPERVLLKLAEMVRCDSKSI